MKATLDSAELLEALKACVETSKAIDGRPGDYHRAFTNAQALIDRSERPRVDSEGKRVTVDGEPGMALGQRKPTISFSTCEKGAER